MERPQGVHPAVYELTQRFTSPVLLGPPMSDKALRLIEHVFSPEEAAVAVGIPSYKGKTAEEIAKKLRRDVAEIQPALDSMAVRRCVLKLVGDDGKTTYALLPIVPGMFEMMLMAGGDGPWYRKFAQLFEELYATGYINQARAKTPGIRYIPIETSLPSESRVLDSDRFSEMLESHTDFGVITVCQCRHTRKLIDHKCKRSRPEDGCLVIGSFARQIEQNGVGRKVSREQMRDIAAERFEKDLVFMTGNVKFNNPNAICTCCDCCCEGIRAINEFDAMNMVAPPHFLAKVDQYLCNDCGKCSKKCNTHAHTMKDKKHTYNAKKCLGCGYCVASCKQNAIKMVDNPAFVPPSDNYLRLGLKLLPAATAAAIKVKLSR